MKLKVGRKIRRCPHCKGKTGFAILIQLGGCQETLMNFRGGLIKTDRQATDSINHYVTCLDCKKTFETDNLDLTNI